MAAVVSTLVGASFLMICVIISCTPIAQATDPVSELRDAEPDPDPWGEPLPSDGPRPVQNCNPACDWPYKCDVVHGRCYKGEHYTVSPRRQMNIPGIGQRLMPRICRPACRRGHYCEKHTVLLTWSSEAQAKIIQKRNVKWDSDAGSGDVDIWGEHEPSIWGGPLWGEPIGRYPVRQLFAPRDSAQANVAIRIEAFVRPATESNCDPKNRLK